MAKREEMRQAEFYFCEKLLNRKEVAEKIGVAEKTVGAWVKKFDWEKKRQQTFNQTKNRVERVKELISKLTEMNLRVVDDIKKAEDQGDTEKAADLRKESNKLSQEVAMQSKLLEQIDKENRINLNTYLEVMEDIFKAMLADYPEVYNKTLDFQENHLNNISIKLG